MKQTNFYRATKNHATVFAKMYNIVLNSLTS